MSTNRHWTCSSLTVMVAIFIVGCSRSDTPLRFELAMMKGDYGTVNKLIMKDPKLVEMKFGDKKETALHIASRGPHYQIVELLIAKGADLESEDINGDTPLSIAASYYHDNSPEKVRTLLVAGAKIKMPSPKMIYLADGFTLLHMATVTGRVGVVEYLLEYGADPCVQDSLGMYPLHWATRHSSYGEERIAYALAKNMPVDALTKKDMDNETPIHYAASSGCLDIVANLLKLGVPIDCPNGYGDTPLHKAAATGQCKLVAFLLSKGADAKAQANEGYTPLHSAARRGDVETLRKLLNVLAIEDVNQQDKGGYTPLNYVPLDSDAAKLLVAHGAQHGESTFWDTISE